MSGIEWDDALVKSSFESFSQKSLEQKEEALMHASDFIGTIPFKGEKLRADQRLAWPRAGVKDLEGNEIIGIPEKVKHATSLAAAFIAAGVSFDDRSAFHIFHILGDLVDDAALEHSSLQAKSHTWH